MSRPPIDAVRRSVRIQLRMTPADLEQLNLHRGEASANEHILRQLRAGWDEADKKEQSDLGASRRGQPVPAALLNLLHYSWEDIGFKYEGLTDQEKACIPREVFNELKEEVQRHGAPASWGATSLDGTPSTPDGAKHEP